MSKSDTPETWEGGNKLLEEAAKTFMDDFTIKQVDEHEYLCVGFTPFSKTTGHGATPLQAVNNALIMSRCGKGIDAKA